MVTTTRNRKKADRAVETAMRRSNAAIRRYYLAKQQLRLAMART